MIQLPTFASVITDIYSALPVPGDTAGDMAGGAFALLLAPGGRTAPVAPGKMLPVAGTPLPPVVTGDPAEGSERAPVLPDLAPPETPLDLPSIPTIAPIIVLSSTGVPADSLPDTRAPESARSAPIPAPIPSSLQASAKPAVLADRAKPVAPEAAAVGPSVAGSVPARLLSVPLPLPLPLPLPPRFARTEPSGVAHHIAPDAALAVREGDRPAPLPAYGNVPLPPVSAGQPLAPAAAAQTPAPFSPSMAAVRPQDFATLVDRLAEARETPRGGIAELAVTHAEFGKVSLSFRHEDGGLTVGLSASDPEFAQAVSAAIPVERASPADAGFSGGRRDGDAHYQQGRAAGGGDAAASGEGRQRGQREPHDHQFQRQPARERGPHGGNRQQPGGRGGIYA